MNILKKNTKNNYDSVWTVSETDLKFHPLKQLVTKANGELNYLDQDIHLRRLAKE